MGQISKWYKWGLYKHGAGVKVIRRYRLVNGKKKWETYPKNKYQDMPPEDIEGLLRRLNASLEAEERAAKERYNYDNAFVNKKVLEEFEKSLRNKAKNQEHIKLQLSNLNQYVFEFFINEKKISDPNQWQTIEASWGDWLLSTVSDVTGRKLGGTYISRIIQTANRLLRFLHRYMPKEVPLIELDPIAKSLLDERDDDSANKGRKKFIKPEDFEKILKVADPRIVVPMKLSYYFGLRRAETLGLNVDCVFEDALKLEQQLVSLTPVPFFDKLKDKEARDIPYWYCTPEEAYELIENLTLIHPDTLSEFFVKACEDLKLPFQFHDLRRTWITRALREHHFMDVRLAAGHEDIETTQGYIQDDREIQRKKFVPKNKKSYA